MHSLEVFNVAVGAGRQWTFILKHNEKRRKGKISYIVRVMRQIADRDLKEVAAVG